MSGDAHNPPLPHDDGSTPCAMPVWLDWMLTATQFGLIVLDGQARVVFTNQWLLNKALLTREQVQGRTLTEVFPPLQGSYFEGVLHQAMRTGFPSMLSQTLHPAPLPLFAQNLHRMQGKPIRQAVHIVPMGPTDAARAGQRYTLIQITDVTPTTLRERLLKAQADKLSDMAHIDALTGIGNRRFFDDSMAAERRSAAREGTPLALVMLDIDFFKQYNDHYGHPAGDRALRAVADLLKKVCRRPRDIVARYGGEELAAILPMTDLPGAVRVAGDILQQLRALALPHVHHAGLGIITCSAGVSACADGARCSTTALIAQADQALYAAKKAGRNCHYYHDPATNTLVAGLSGDPKPKEHAP
jgi:diguanylate cyclase (GGDEF)-like protein